MKYIEKLQEILNNEFQDWDDIKWEIHHEDSETENGEWYEEYYVEFSEEAFNPIRIRLTEKIQEVERGEDNWEKFETFEWTIKYFWQALLWQ